MANLTPEARNKVWLNTGETVNLTLDVMQNELNPVDDVVATTALFSIEVANDNMISIINQ